MIHFNELRYSRDNKSLIIDVAIDNKDYFEDVVLSRIMIDTQDTFVVNGPSSTPIYSFKVPDAYDKTYSLPEDCNCGPVKVQEDESYCFTTGTDMLKHVRLELPLSLLGINASDTMLFVYVIATGTPTIDTPCGMDNSKIVGTVVDLQAIYKQTISYLREIECNCEIPKDFINMILRYKAIELCIRTGNYPQAIKYWKKFFAGYKNTIIPKCGCYG